jgi:hypothetical protein
MHVAGQGWSSVWIADALEKRSGYERLHQLIDYATNRLGAESLEDPQLSRNLSGYAGRRMLPSGPMVKPGFHATSHG